jgi:hypothetical protein
MAMTVSLWWFCLGQYAPYNCGNLVWLKYLSNQERISLHIVSQNLFIVFSSCYYRCFFCTVMPRALYPSDITPEQFEIIRPHPETFKKATKPRELDLYDIFW